MHKDNACYFSSGASRGHLLSRRGWAITLALTVIYILYGSLYPFEYVERSFPDGAGAYLMSTWRDWDHRGDLLSNILLYLPLGYATAMILPRRLPTVGRLLIATMVGALLAGGIEIAQFHDSGRVASMGDVYANSIGAMLGVSFAATTGAGPRWPFVGELMSHPRPAMLLAMWAGYRFYPYVPTIDLHKYWHAVRPIFTTPSLDLPVIAEFTIVWLFVACILNSLYGFRRWLVLFPCLAGAEFLGRILIISSDLKMSDIVGALAASALWPLLHRRAVRFPLLSLAMVAIVVRMRLAPFDFQLTGRPFGWVPFHSMMHGSTGVAIQAFCQKFYLYGGIIWLSHRAGVRLGVAVVVLALLLLGTSYLETYLIGRSAEITDAVMALTIGIVFHALRGATGDRAPKPFAKAAENRSA